jgi:hypothetical protein
MRSPGTMSLFQWINYLNGIKILDLGYLNQRQGRSAALGKTKGVGFFRSLWTVFSGHVRLSKRFSIMGMPHAEPW